MASELLKALGIGAGTIGAGAALHGAGLGRVLEPLDYPRQALYNLIRSPIKAMERGNVSDLMGAVPGVAGAVLGGVVGGPLGVLAGSALGGALQGVGKATGRQEFQAPSVSDLTGTEDFLPNFAAGALTDPLSYAGLGATWNAGKGALAARAAKPATPLGELAAKAIPEASAAAIPVAKLAEPLIPEAKQIAPMFYSRLESAINTLPKEMNAEAVLNRLKRAPGGIHPEELEATGLAEMLAGKKRVTKEELLNHFAENKVQVNEVMKGGQKGFLDSNSPEYARYEELGTLYQQGIDFSPAEEAEYRQLDNIFSNQDASSRNAAPKYYDYKTGGEVPGSYRELVLTLPEKKLPEGYKVVPVENPHAPPKGVNFRTERTTGDAEDFLGHYQAVHPETGDVHGYGNTAQEAMDEAYRLSAINHKTGQSYQIVDPKGNAVLQNGMFPSEEQAIAAFNRKRGVSYQSEHWDEANPLAHVRFQDKLGPKGEKILSIEEIQSDLHQAGKKEGYRDPGKQAQFEAAEKKAYDAQQELNQFRDRVFGEGYPQTAPESITEQQAEFTRLRRQVSDADAAVRNLYGATKLPPDMPFKENWHELSLKRMIRYAAENNYDAIQINSGKAVQGYTYGKLAGQEQFYDKVLPKWLERYAKSHGVTLEHAEAGRSLPITASMREQALTKGFPLANVGLPLAGGGGALLAALLGQRETA